MTEVKIYTLTLEYLDDGFCRAVYSSETGARYSVSDEGEFGFKFYRLTGDDEPSHEVSVKNKRIPLIPDASAYFEKYNAWIKSQGVSV